MTYVTALLRELEASDITPVGSRVIFVIVNQTFIRDMLPRHLIGRVRQGQVRANWPLLPAFSVRCGGEVAPRTGRADRNWSMI